MSTIAILATMAAMGSAPKGSPATLDLITFADQPGAYYLPAREVANTFGVDIGWNADEQQLSLRGTDLDMGQTRKLRNGTVLIHTGTMQSLGFQVSESDSDQRSLSLDGSTVHLREGDKRVVVNKEALELRAYQGERQILSTHISVGMDGHDTPNGVFNAGPYKAEMHRSSLYDNAPMPWSVQVVGNIFIHGWEGNVGGRNSRGCIRLPVDGTAEFFYRWIDLGTPVAIQGDWPAGAIERNERNAEADRSNSGG